MFKHLDTGTDPQVAIFPVPIFPLQTGVNNGAILSGYLEGLDKLTQVKQPSWCLGQRKGSIELAITITVIIYILHVVMSNSGCREAFSKYPD